MYLKCRCTYRSYQQRIRWRHMRSHAPVIGIGAGSGWNTRWSSGHSIRCSKQHPSTQHSVTTRDCGIPDSSVGLTAEHLQKPHQPKPCQYCWSGDKGELDFGRLASKENPTHSLTTTKSTAAPSSLSASVTRVPPCVTRAFSSPSHCSAMLWLNLNPAKNAEVLGPASGLTTLTTAL